MKVARGDGTIGQEIVAFGIIIIVAIIIAFIAHAAGDGIAVKLDFALRFCRQLNELFVGIEDKSEKCR